MSLLIACLSISYWYTSFCFSFKLLLSLLMFFVSFSLFYSHSFFLTLVLFPSLFPLFYGLLTYCSGVFCFIVNIAFWTLLSAFYLILYYSLNELKFPYLRYWHGNLEYWPRYSINYQLRYYYSTQLLLFQLTVYLSEFCTDFPLKIFYFQL